MSKAIPLSEALIRSWLPQRPEDGHKGTFGKVCILAGSEGYTGAPVLAARSAVRGGTGLVFLQVPRCIYPIIAVKCDEAMPAPLPDEGGACSKEALPLVLERMNSCDAALIGPGLGQSDGLDSLVFGALEHTQLPVVLDADGLNAASRHRNAIAHACGPRCIMTPHDGEYRRLTGRWPDSDRIEGALALSRAFHHCVAVLKGHNTVVTNGAEIYINTTGNAGMAKGGSGDVLTGLMVSLLAQGMEPVKAAAAAVWIHGRAGDLCEAELGQRAMTPCDLIGHFAPVLKPLETRR